MTSYFPPRILSLALVPLLLATPACAGQIVPPPDPGAMAAARPPAYADVADLVLAAPLVIDATIRSAARIKGAEAAGVAPGAARFYVEADVATLIKGTDAIPARVGWLIDVAPGPDGRLPRLKKQRVLAFARKVAGSAGQVQLVGNGAQRDWTPPLDALARRIAEEANAPDAPPIMTGVTNAFHVPGSLPGEGETQIFLSTKTGRPAALQVLRRPGEQPRWSVTTSEIIDENATAPAHDTLLWYRLACALPPELPVSSTASLQEADAAVAREDYAIVLAQLGPCRGDAPVAGAPPAEPAPMKQMPAEPPTDVPVG